MNRNSVGPTADLQDLGRYRLIDPGIGIVFVTSPVVVRLLDELVDHYRYLGAAAIRRAIESSIKDLDRSVHPDDLPEMALRLALDRLSMAVDQVA